jgi:membrane associated rhomboid family serine protease
MNVSLKSDVNRLVIFLVALFFLTHLFLLFFDTNWDEAIQWVGYPSVFKNFLIRPWTLVTHFLIHLNFAHLMLNLILLYSMGHWLEELKGGRYFYKIFFLGIFAGVLCYAFSGQMGWTQDRYLLGGSAGAMSVMGCILALQPKRKMNFFGVFIIEVTWLVVIVVLIDLIGIRQGWNVGGHLAHWGGLFMGFGIAKWTSEKKPYTDIYHHRRPKTDDEFNHERVERENKLNAILDKINRSGFDSLTSSEKDFLNQQSR